MGNEDSKLQPGEVNEDSKLQPGDVLHRGVSSVADHCGVYIGGGEVIHFLPGGIVKGSLDDFANGIKVHVKSYPTTRSRDEIVETAIYLLKNEEDWDKYSLFSNNCEHFACYCATGEKKSKQVAKAVIAGIVGVAVASKIASSLLTNNDDKDDSEDSDRNVEATVAHGAKLISSLYSNDD